MPTINQIVSFLRAQKRCQFLVNGVESFEIKKVSSLKDADENSITFCRNTAQGATFINSSKAALVIVDETLKIDIELMRRNRVKAIISSDNPRRDFILVVRKFFTQTILAGIHPSAVIAPKAKLGNNLFIGPLCTIGNAEIGNNCVIYAGVHIYDNVKIGNNVVIHAGTVIGSDGFGYERNPEGELEKFPHIGGVVIEDDVEIGANTCIDKGTLENTTICQGAKIDNLVHIAHNVYIGKHVVVIANAMIGGGVRIEDYAWVAPSASIRNQINIGKSSTIGIGAVVTKNIDPGITVLGVPARELSEYKALLSALNKLANKKKNEIGNQ